MKVQSWLQPLNIKHTVLGYSDDCELLEIIMPADFDTNELRSNMELQFFEKRALVNGAGKGIGEAP